MSGLSIAQDYLKEAAMKAGDDCDELNEKDDRFCIPGIGPEDV